MAMPCCGGGQRNMAQYTQRTQPTHRRLQWLRLIQREDLTNRVANHRVCNVHFKPQDIQVNTSRKLLKRNCLPSLHLPIITKEDKEIQVDLMTTTNVDTCSQTEMRRVSDNITQTTVALSTNIPCYQKLKSELLTCKRQLRIHETRHTTKKWQNDTFRKLCDRFLSKDLANFVKNQTRLHNSHRGNRYSLEYKMFCLNLYYISPRAYRFLQKTFCLPCKATLNNFHIPIPTQIKNDLMTALKMKTVNMSDKEKKCAIVVGVMNLKANMFYDIKKDKIIGFHEVDNVQSPSPAERALVLLVRGIFVNWQQPIAYALLSECKSDVSISKWIDKIILKLFEIGLDIRVFVSNLGSDWVNIAYKRDISVNKTYFTINDHRIYYVFDAPHLMKLIRNEIMTYDFHFHNGAVAKFEHVVKLYEYDRTRPHKQTHKLTNSHINPTEFEKGKTRYATELLSRSVANTLSTCIDFQIVDESGRDTVEFIIMINDLFDALNSSTFRNNYSPKNAFCGDVRQIEFFNKMLFFFETLKLINPNNGDDTKYSKCIKGFQITIKSILLMYEDLKHEGHPYLLTRRLNQDIIEKLFVRIRSKSDVTTEPTSRKFISAFRNIFFSTIRKPPKEGNRAKSLAKFFLHLDDFTNVDTKSGEIDVILPSGETESQESDLREIMSSDYKELNIPKNNSFYYVCGFLLKKCADRHKCESFYSYMYDSQRACNVKVESENLSHNNYTIDDKLNLLVALPDDKSKPDIPSDDKSNLPVVPFEDFIKNIERMEQVFREAFEKEHINSKIGLSMYEKMKNIEFISPCLCFPKTYLQKLFIRMRIYFTLSNNNEAFRACRNRPKQFSITNF